jgi:hypothetical protein
MARKPQTSLRLDPDLKRRLRERARIRAISEPELIREFISIGLGGADAHLNNVAASLDDLRRQVEEFSQIERAADSRDVRRQTALTGLLERLLTQSTEVLMILRVVTHKDRKEDYALALKHAQDSLANHTATGRPNGDSL